MAQFMTQTSNLRGDCDTKNVFNCFTPATFTVFNYTVWPIRKLASKPAAFPGDLNITTLTLA